MGKSLTMSVMRWSWWCRTSRGCGPDFEDPAIHCFRCFAHMPELLDPMFSHGALDVVHHQQQIGFDKPHPPPMEESGISALCVQKILFRGGGPLRDARPAAESNVF